MPEKNQLDRPRQNTLEGQLGLETGIVTQANVESPSAEAEDDENSQLVLKALVQQVLQLNMVHPKRGRYINPLQALLAGETGDVGRIAFLTTSPVAEAREQLSALAETGVASVQVDTSALNLYLLASPAAK